MPSPSGTCEFKADPNHDCLYRWVGSGMAATAICNCLVSDAKRGDICPRYYREAELVRIQPATFCCPSMRQLFHLCAEASGCYAGAFDLRRYPNDGKDVWRNYERVGFVFCPFCGRKLSSYVDEEQRVGEGAPSPARR